MALIISPKTTQEQIKQLSKHFNLNKIPRNEANLELGNLNDNFYFAKVDKVPLHIILTGYGGASVGFSIAQYEKNYKHKDPFPEAYFIGSILKTKRARHLKLGDILYAEDTLGEDEWSKAIYKVAKLKGLKDITKPDKNLIKRITDIAAEEHIELKKGRIFSRWHPGVLENYQHVRDLLDKGMWWKFALSEGEYKKHAFDGGEIECASFTATCNLAGIPSIALLDVRDERVGKGYGEDAYKIVSQEDKKKAQENILKLIKLSVNSLNK